MANIEDFWLNIELFRLINGHRLPFLDSFFLYARFLGRAEILVPLLVLLFVLKRREEFCRLLFSSLLTGILVVFLKITIDAPRPASHLQGVILLLGYYRMSFPSGDSAVASIVLLFFYRKVSVFLKPLLMIYWFIICYGRIYLGVHFPLDVIGGFVVALLSMWIVNALLQKGILFDCNRDKKLI